MVLPGFNTDFKYKGLVYHAQTEDNGVSNPVVVTLLYLKGAILASRKTSYKDLLEKEDIPREVMELMKAQHRDMMKEVLAGKYDSPPEPAAEAAPAPAEAAPAPAETAPAPAEAAPAPAEAAPAPAEAPPASAAVSPLAAETVTAEVAAASRGPKSLDEAIMELLASYKAGNIPDLQ